MEGEPTGRAGQAGGGSPLALLLGIHVRQAWRKVLDIRQQSRLLTFLIGSFMLGYVGFAFWMFWFALKLVGRFPGLGGMLAERLLYLLFAFLFVMLLFSNLVINYTNLFRNRETAFLIPLPIPTHVIYQWKLLESAILASWAFLFLIAPFLVAYGLNFHAPWHFYLVTPILVGIFIVIPAVAGAWGAIMVARHLDRKTFQIAALVSGLACLILMAVAFQPAPIADDMLETRVMDVLDRLMYRTRFAQAACLPSHWLAASVVNWSEGAWLTAGFFALVMLSNALFFGYLGFTRLGGAFYEANSAVQSRGRLLANWWSARQQARGRRFEFRGAGLESAFKLLFWLRSDTRALLVKDARLFWRDTSQWAQTLMLFGLLGIYILNLRQFSRQLTNPFWINLVSHLNLLACSLNLATLTNRFVFPQFSLEGKRFWIIGMAPLGLLRIARAKFWLASGASWLLTCGLMWLSCHMLQMEWQQTLFFMGAVSVMTFTLCGLAVGLGTLYPNLKEDNPGKIVSGFGGTFCLVLSFIYIIGSVVVLAATSPITRWGLPSPERTALGGTLFLVWSVLAGWVPFRLGLRRLKTMEVY